MKRAFLLVASLSIGACGGTEPAATPTPSEDIALFVTRLGDDTLAVERVRRTDDSLYAIVLLRAPQTTLRTYRVALDGTGRPMSMTVSSYDPATGFEAAPTATTSHELGAGSGIPFMDMVHWPFELMIERAAASPTDTLTLPLVAGDRLLPFRMQRLGDGRFSATHPTRGTMTIEADAEGRLRLLDAANTTRALTVTRAPDGDITPLARSFAARPMGELSGRGEVSTTVGGAQIDVDYGVPLKRGREIFGALVPFDRVWRTGANRATHFSTTRALRFGATVIPAGTYTLFTIPRADRWTLIVNRNVDINGQQYDESADLARIDLAVRPLTQTVEPFTIVVEPDGPSGGLLRLRWDRTEAWAPFTTE